MTASQDARNYLARERGEPESPPWRAEHDRYPICSLPTCGRVIFPSDDNVDGRHKRCAGAGKVATVTLVEGRFPEPRPEPGSPADPARHNAWLNDISGIDEDCRCDHAYRKSLGRLHGVTMGPGWVRTTTHPNCAHHGIAAAAEHDRRMRERLGLPPKRKP